VSALGAKTDGGGGGGGGGGLVVVEFELPEHATSKSTAAIEDSRFTEPPPFSVWKPAF
jgi:hypothetical protein